MSNELTILYQHDESDKLFSFLQTIFGNDVGNVTVDSRVPNELVSLNWDGLHSYKDVATQLTEEFPNIIIETPSSTGIDSTSRYFNGSQLW
jgi:hypothetical protein